VLEAPEVAPPEPPGEVPLDPVPELHPSMLIAKINAEVDSKSRHLIPRKLFIVILLRRWIQGVLVTPQTAM
jgi:hypothetical protein